MAPGSNQSEIDNLKQAEQALIQEKQFSHSLLESMADGVVACDANGVLMLFNRSAREELVREEHGAAVGVRGIVMDITRQKLVEERLRKLTDELERRVKERTKELEDKNAELENMNRLFVGRELRMVELKEKVAELEKQIREISTSNET